MILSRRSNVQDPLRAQTMSECTRARRSSSRRALRASPSSSRSLAKASCDNANNNNNNNVYADSTSWLNVRQWHHNYVISPMYTRAPMRVACHCDTPCVASCRTARRLGGRVVLRRAHRVVDAERSEGLHLAGTARPGVRLSGARRRRLHGRSRVGGHRTAA